VGVEVEFAQTERLSVKERDRRWDAVRQLMDSHQLEAIVAPHSTSPAGLNQLDSCYLTGCGTVTQPVACFFPRRGDPIAFVKDVDRCASAKAWTPIARDVVKGLPQGIVEAHRDAGLTRGRVGLSGLTGVPNATEGVASYGLVRILREQLPDIDWVDVTHQLRAIRMVKSTEETALLTRAARLVDRSLERASTAAQPGSTDLEVWSAAIAELCVQGSQPPLRSRWGSGLRPTMVDRPMHGELQRGSIVVAEIDAERWGYRTYGIQPIAVAGCDAILRDLYAVEGEFWDACFELLKPGLTFRQLLDETEAVVTQFRTRPGRYEKLQGTLAIDGCGLGLDAPTLDGRLRDESMERETLRAGSVVVLRPLVSIDIGFRVLSATWADTVVIEEHGARRLGERSVGLLTV